MNKLKKTLAVLFLAAVPVIGFAQDKQLFRQTLEIVEIEHDGDEAYSVFSMPENGENHYFLTLGHLGIGDDIIQFNIDPLYVLFIPLGDALEDAEETLNQLNELAKLPNGHSMEFDGCLSFPYPNDEEIEAVTVTSSPFLFTKRLKFSVTRGEYVRATYVNRSDIVTMLNGVKLHQKLHPNE